MTIRSFFAMCWIPMWQHRYMPDDDRCVYCRERRESDQTKEEG